MKVHSIFPKTQINVYVVTIYRTEYSSEVFLQGFNFLHFIDFKIIKKWKQNY